MRNRNILKSQAKGTYVVPVVGVKAETEQLEAHRNGVFSVESFHCDMQRSVALAQRPDVDVSVVVI